MLKRNKLHFEGNFTQIPNAWVRDSRLSYKARGILVWLMSHEVGWRTSTKQLESDHDKRDAIKAALKELEQYGYLVRQQGHSAETGKFTQSVWILNDPFTDLPQTDLPQTDFPLTANPHTKNTNSKKTNLENIFSDDWKPTDQQRTELQAKYPNANLDQYLQEMMLWIVENGQQKKIKSMSAKFSRWMINADKYAKGELSKTEAKEERPIKWG